MKLGINIDDCVCEWGSVGQWLDCQTENDLAKTQTLSNSPWPSYLLLSTAAEYKWVPIISGDAFFCNMKKPFSLHFPGSWQ
jgi:hypothetical protein